MFGSFGGFFVTEFMMPTYYLEKPSIFYDPNNCIPKVGHCVIEASAGTGKTYTISKLFVDLIYQGIDPVKCLFITFTNKATAELQERLRKEVEGLANAFRCPNPDATQIKVGDDTLKTSVSADDAYKFWCMDELHQQRFLNAVDQFSKIRISTIDSLTHNMMQENGDLSSLAPKLVVSNELPEDIAFANFMRFDVTNDDWIKAVVCAYEHYEKSDSNKLSNGGNYDINACFKKHLIDAYKTGTASCIPIEQIVKFEQNKDETPDIAYRNRCIEALTEFYQLLEGQTPEEIKGSIKKAKFIVQKNKKEKLFGAFKIHGAMFSTDPWRYWLLGMQDVSQAEFNTHKDYQPNLTPLTTAVDRLKQLVVDRVYFLTRYALPKFAATMEQVKQSQGVFEHNDFTQKLAYDVQTSEKLKQRFRERWSVAVVDEFQDTSADQWNLFSGAFMNLVENENGVKVPKWQLGDPRLFVIGDPKQAIYSFRGGDLVMYRHAVKTVAMCDCHTNENQNTKVTLDTNYRASKKVIDACNIIFDHYWNDQNKSLPEVQCMDFVKVNSVHDDWVIYDTMTDCEAKKMSPAVYYGKIENDRIAEIIDRLLNEAVIVKGKGSDQKIKNVEKICILGRKVDDFNSIKTALNMRGIDYIGTGLKKAAELFSLPEVLSLVRVMYAVLEPYKAGNIEAALNSILFGIQLDQLGNVYDHKDPEASVLGRKFIEWNKLARDRKQLANIGIIFEDILKFSNFAERLALLSESLMPYENVRAVIDYLSSLAIVEKLDWASLIARMSAIRHGEVSLGENELYVAHPQARVELMTIHKSKGLEADIVIVLPVKESSSSIQRFLKYHEEKATDEGGIAKPRVFPQMKNGNASSAKDMKQALDEQQAEEIRLLYVALTRAKMRLYICKSEKSNLDFYDKLDALMDEMRGASNPVIADMDEQLRTYWPPTSSLDDSLSELQRRGAPDAVADGQSDAFSREHLPVRRGRTVVTYSSVAPKLDLTANDDVWGRESIYAPREQGTAPVMTRGKNTGNFLHKLLEVMPLDDFQAVYATDQAKPLCSPLESFNEQNKLREKSERIQRIYQTNQTVYRISDTDLALAKKMLQNTLLKPLANVPLNGFRAPEKDWLPTNLCALTRRSVARELEFICDASQVFDDETAKFFFCSTDADGQTVFDEAGWQRFMAQLKHNFDQSALIKGTFDAVFQVGNRLFLLDWKSDSLERFDQASMRDYVMEHFIVQASFYAYAIKSEMARINAHKAECLDAHKAEGNEPVVYGGMLYVFLRGINDDPQNSDGFFFIPPEV